MSEAIELFLIFAEKSAVELKPYDGEDKTMYCGVVDRCSECVLYEQCSLGNPAGVLNPEDLEEMQDKYPEYFI